MKKILLILLALLPVVALTGCDKDEPQIKEESQNKEDSQIKDDLIGTIWVKNPSPYQNFRFFIEFREGNVICGYHESEEYSSLCSEQMSGWFHNLYGTYSRNGANINFNPTFNAGFCIDCIDEESPIPSHLHTGQISRCELAGDKLRVWITCYKLVAADHIPCEDGYAELLRWEEPDNTLEGTTWEANIKDKHCIIKFNKQLNMTAYEVDDKGVIQSDIYYGKYQVDAFHADYYSFTKIDLIDNYDYDVQPGKLGSAQLSTDKKMMRVSYSWGAGYMQSGEAIFYKK